MIFAAGEIEERCDKSLMQVPGDIPGFKLFTVLVSVYAVLWIALEGHLGRVILLGCAVSLWLLAVAVRRWLGGRWLSPALWVAVCGALGAITGFVSGMLTLLFMAVKTGLHAHGPEFSPVQIEWVIGQLPWWTSAGLLAGAGLAMIGAVVRQK